MQKIYQKALKIRAAEEQLLFGYKNRDFGGTVHTCIGQEILPAMLSEILAEDIFVISNHRGHGHFIAHTNDLKLLFREFLAKEYAPSKGIGGSQHLYDECFLSNGIQGCTAPFAAGIGLVKPTLYYLGDGTFGEGTLYEALNLAILTKSRLLLIVEDNEISQSTPSRNVLMGPGIPDRLRSFGVHTLEVDSADPLAMHQTILKIPDMWKNQDCIALVCKSYRLRSHSKGDDTRSQSTIEKLPDPVRILAEKLNLDYDSDIEAALNEVKCEWSEVKSEDDIKPPIYEKSTYNSFYTPELSPPSKRINQIIRDAIENRLNEGSIFIGEDLITKWSSQANPYGGAFGISLDLSEKFNGVIGTSISEAGLVGLAAGKAFASKKLSIAEIMFADFGTLIVDQIYNGVDKYKKMFGAKLDIPLAIRLPYGMGRGYGPTHSQTPIEIFSGLTEFVTISYTPFLNYDSLLRDIDSSGSSALIFEPKIYYGDSLSDWLDVIEGYDILPLPGKIASSLLITTSRTPAVKIISHGSAVKPVLESIKKYSINCEFIIASELFTDYNYLSQFTDKNSPLVIIEEKNSSHGALFTTISKLLTGSKRITSIYTNSPVKNIPANSEWEKSLMINVESVYKIIKEALL